MMIHEIALERTYGLRARLLEWMAKKVYWFVQACPSLRRPGWAISLQQLQRRPAGSLGRGMADFYEREQIQMMDGYERHDVFHVLLGYGTAIQEEGQLVFCLLGNGKRSVPTIASSLMAALFFPEYWGAFAEAYQRGQCARPFWHWQFEYLLSEPVSLLRQMTGLEAGSQRVLQKR